MTPSFYQELKDILCGNGFADEIEWAENIEPCPNARSFAEEAVWVIINSGLKNQVARGIYNKVSQELFLKGKLTGKTFGHERKVEAINFIFKNQDNLFLEYQNAEDKLAYLETLPHIGLITKYHLAKNLGLDMVKPDRHLVRIAKKYQTSPLKMCQKLAQETGDKLALIDTVIWLAANLGIL